jgi:hypothetical protein
MKKSIKSIKKTKKLERGDRPKKNFLLKKIIYKSKWFYHTFKKSKKNKKKKVKKLKIKFKNIV